MIASFSSEDITYENLKFADIILQKDTTTLSVFEKTSILQR